MPVEIQSDLILSSFWQSVKREMERLLEDRGLLGWKVTIRPRTQADGFFASDPAAFNLSKSQAERLDRGGPEVDVDVHHQSAMINVPDQETFFFPEEDSPMTALDLAEEFVDLLV